MTKSKLFLLSVLGLFLTTVAFAENPPEPTYSNQIKKSAVGQRQGEPTRVVKLVRFALQGANSASRVSGDAVVYDKTSDDGVTVATTTTSGDGAFAGIACTALQTVDGAGSGTSAFDDAGKRNWGWIVVHGPATATVTAGGTNTNLAGQIFITSTDAGAITSLELPRGVNGGISADVATVQSEVKAGAAAGGFFFDNADGASTSVEVFVENE